MAIDPGPERSAYVSLRDGRPVQFGIVYNGSLRHALRLIRRDTVVVIEQIASMGMIVGSEVFETAFESGKFAQIAEDATGQTVARIKRADVKLHLCGQARAKDPNVRQALIDRFGPGKERAIGKKATPGPLYGISADCWAALAVGVTHHDRQTNPQRH